MQAVRPLLMTQHFLVEQNSIPVGDYTLIAPAGTTADDVLKSTKLPPSADTTTPRRTRIRAVKRWQRFCHSPFVQDMSEIAEGTFRAQVVHAAAGLGQVDIWNITDPDSANHAILIEPRL